MEEVLLETHELPERMQAWLKDAPPAFALAVEQLADGRVLLRPLPEVDPTLLAHLRVTIAKYHEALMNLS